MLHFLVEAADASAFDGLEVDEAIVAPASAPLVLDGPEGANESGDLLRGRSGRAWCAAATFMQSRCTVALLGFLLGSAGPIAGGVARHRHILRRGGGRGGGEASCGHTVVQVSAAVSFALGEHAASVAGPIGGVDADGKRALGELCVDDRDGFELGEPDEGGPVGGGRNGRGAGLLAGLVNTRVGVVGVEHSAVVGIELKVQLHEATSAAAVAVASGAVKTLLLGEVHVRAFLDGEHALEHRGGGEGGARTA